MNISPDPQLASINSDLMDRYDKLLLKETKTHNENVELKSKIEELKKDLKTFKDLVVEALGGPEFNGPYKDCIRSRDIICEIAALKNPNLCDPETGEIIGLKDFGYLKKENEELKKVVKSNRDLFDASEKDVKRLKEQLESTQNSLGSTSAEYEKLVDNSNNDNLNFGDILFEREEEIKRLTKTLQLAEDKIKDLKEDDDCRPDAWDAM